MTSAQKFLIVLQLASFLAILAYLSYQLLKAKQETHKYKLYALRDRLLYLVATGELEERNLVFQVFYNAINSSICEIKGVSLWSIARASVAARSAIEQERHQRLWAAINKTSPVVREVLSDFYETMMEIAISNSLLLVIIVHLAGNSHQMFTKCLHMLSKLRIFLRERQRYDAYRFFDGGHNRLAT